MSDRFTETTTKGWGSRLGDSIKAVLIGLILFIGSFGVLYWNEGKVDLSKVAETAIEVQADAAADTSADDQLVSVTGVFSTIESLGDTYLAEGDYIALHRDVEMYAWVEETETETRTNVGGSETTETTYNYVKKWVNSPTNSSEFRIPEGHQNPEIPFEDITKTVNLGTLGMYELDMNELDLPSFEQLTLTNENTLPTEGMSLANGEYLFSGTGSLSAPTVGDVRIGYSVVDNPISSATVFGQLDQSNQAITPFYGEKNAKLYRVFEGNRATAISTLTTEHNILTWILRAAGFLMMWIGLGMLFGPISVFLDVLPIFGSISRAGIGLITFIVALAFSIVTILISMIIHNIIALIVSIAVLVGLLIWYMKSKKKK